ncbi:hypothetical protein ACHQM5_022920 [Ranunculus cassubicifolius]
MPASASAPDLRTRNICLWLISCLLLGCIIVGCGLLIKYVFFNAPIQVAEIGLTLIAIPWLFWFLTYLYRCISRSFCNPNPSGASAAGGGGMSRRLASISGSNAPSKRSAAVANDSPVVSPGSAARRVHFGDVIVLNEQDEQKQYGSESDGHHEKASSTGSSNNDYDDISSPESQVECERPLSTSRPSS